MPANKTGAALASAARTATATSETFVNTEHKGIVVYLRVTAAGAGGGLSVRVRGIDPVSKAALEINADPTDVTATGTTTYVIYPGASAGATQSTSGILPRNWDIVVNAANTDSYTYSVGYSLIS